MTRTPTIPAGVLLLVLVSPVFATAQAPAPGGIETPKTLSPLDRELVAMDKLRTGFDTPIDEVERRGKALLRTYTKPEEQAKIYYQLAHIGAQSGVPRPADTIDYVKKALDLPLPRLERSQLYMYWGNAIEVSNRGARGPALAAARRQAAEPYLAGLKESLSYADEVQKRPLPDAPREVPGQFRPDNKALAARKLAEWKQKQDLERGTGFQTAFRDQIAFLYSRMPFATDEIDGLSKKFLEDDEESGRVMGLVKSRVQKRLEGLQGNRTAELPKELWDGPRDGGVAPTQTAAAVRPAAHEPPTSGGPATENTSASVATVAAVPAPGGSRRWLVVGTLLAAGAGLASVAVYLHRRPEPATPIQVGTARAR